VLLPLNDVNAASLWVYTNGANPGSGAFSHDGLNGNCAIEDTDAYTLVSMSAGNRRTVSSKYCPVATSYS
jgi:hypothetical protein